MKLEKLFCDVDDFCQGFEKTWRRELLSAGERKRDRKLTLCLSEVMTIIIYFHQFSYRNFKDYYIKIAYTYQDKKPSLNLTTEDLATLPEANFSHSEALGLVVA